MKRKNLLRPAMGLVLLAGLYSSSNAQNSTTVFSTIAGTVWKETLPSDGVRQTGEQRVPGILITMYDALTDKVIAAGISDTSGHFLLRNYAGVGDYYIKYGYPTAGYSLSAKRLGTDNHLNSSADPSTGATDAFSITDTASIDTFGLGVIPVANKITYCDVKSLSVTDWNTSFTFPKSNDALIGTLTKVTLFIADAVWHPLIGVENTGAQAISTTLGFSGLLTLTPPTGGANEVTTTLLNKQVSLPAYDGQTDYGGLSGRTWSNEFSSITNQNRTFTTNAQLNIFRGATGTVAFPVTAQNSFTITGGGNLENSVQTHVGAGACVVYEYAGGISLPISLVDFTAEVNGSSALLNWETAQELGNKGFAVERSDDGKNFVEIDFVNSLAGNDEGVSYQHLSYTYKDMQPFSGWNYYRLKQVDINGKATYSPVKKVLMGAETSATMYPNPANGFVILDARHLKAVSMFDLGGKAIPVSYKTQPDGLTKITLDKLRAGTYTVLIQLTDGSSVSRQIVIQH